MSERPQTYAVIFISQRTTADASAYAGMADRMLELAAEQPGFLGVDSVRGQDGFGITVSYWESREAIAAWKSNAEHRLAQELGRSQWYSEFRIYICKVDGQNDWRAADTL